MCENKWMWQKRYVLISLQNANSTYPKPSQSIFLLFLFLSYIILALEAT